MVQYHSFDPATGHRLPHDPIKAIVGPRPIGWISTRSADGVLNLAPYSYFNMFCHKPPILIFGSEGRKDTLRNVEETREFAFNLATRDMAEAVNATSAAFPPGTDEFAACGLDTMASDVIRTPWVATVAAAMECRLVGTQQLTDAGGRALAAHLVIGEVVRVHIDEACLVDGLFDIRKARTIARCGYRGDYVDVEKTFELLRPR